MTNLFFIAESGIDRSINEWPTPASRSWLYAFESFFAKLVQKRLRRGVFKSVTELEKAMAHIVKAHNDGPKPFLWTETAEKIIERVGRARLAMEKR